MRHPKSQTLLLVFLGLSLSAPALARPLEAVLDFSESRTGLHVVFPSVVLPQAMAENTRLAVVGALNEHYIYRYGLWSAPWKSTLCIHLYYL